MPAAHRELRERLEGRTDVLEVTRVRYRALCGMVSAFFWRERLRRNAPLLHQVALAQPVVDRVLDPALRRARAEGWPAGEPLTALLHELEALRHRLRADVARRLGRGEDTPLPELLVELEALVAAEVKVEPGHRWAAAEALLPWSLPELIRASERGELLERLLKRPLDLHARLPFTLEEAELIAAAVPEAEAALEAVWRRVDGVDPTGALRRLLAQRGRRAPMHAPRNGAEALLRTLFWLDYAKATVRQLVAPRVAPVPVSEAELWPVFRWLVALQEDALVRLPAGPALAEARAGLLELAWELNRLERLTERAPLGRFRAVARPGPEGSTARWESILARARRAETLGETPDAAGLKQALTRFIRMRAPKQVRATPGTASFEALVLEAASVGSNPPG